MKICAVDYFEETVNQFPDKIAIIDGERRICFNELKNKCVSLAALILESNEAVINRPIGVFIGKSANTIIADISVNYTGNVYVNLDVNSPAARISSIINRLAPVGIITEKRYLEQLNKIIDLTTTENIAIILIDEIGKKQITEKQRVNLTAIREQQIDMNPCCIITTSGSTGTPKGIVMPYKNLADYLDWAVTTFGFNENTIDGNLSSTVFDHFVYEMWLMIGTGATLVLLDSSMMSFPVKLLQVMQKENVNYIFWVPSMMVNIANMDLLSKISLPRLELIWFAGEIFPTKQFNYWKKAFPNATFVNLYGPAEITIDCTFYIVNRQFADDEAIPIGNARKNMDVFILNENQALCDVGETGEIYVRGTSVTFGYYNDSDKTKEVYVQNPLHNNFPEIVYKTGDMGYVNQKGEIVFKGRKDSLIKHMGCRIELTEIEHTVISRLKLVQYCCVVYNKAKKEITLFYESDQEISNGIFRKELLKLLPKYMLPVKYIRKDVLPRNVNGKIDRNKLSKEINHSC